MEMHHSIRAFSYFLFFVFVTVSGKNSTLKLKYDSHPFLYFSLEDIPQLQLMARTTHSHLAAKLKEAADTIQADPSFYNPSGDYRIFGARWNEIYGNNLPPLALYCVLNPGDTETFLFTVKYMDTMASLPKWQVISAETDEVPVSHSLTGFVTAFDFLFYRLDDDRKQLYLERILNETKAYAKYTKIRSWGSFHLQNHVATNFLAFFHASLVTALHFEKTIPWLNYVIVFMERNLKLLSHVIDGSLDEGVAYGSYTSRSLTQYAFLALRHFGLDHSQDNWFQQHFWFYYYTVLPDFQRTVGIADSNYNWFYGPESQLMFLDTYVLRKGWGNWLAEQIRANKGNETTNPLYPPRAFVWCTLHTEFLWYDASIPAVSPPLSEFPELHTFYDWGVTTYRTPMQSQNATYLAFKSGALHGQGIFDIVNQGMYPWLRGWRSFNAGHEHPDQNSFVLMLAGQSFVTDTLYGPKMSSLNNVLIFSPSKTSQCNSPWEGQLGECGKWMQWTSPKMAGYRGELIHADEKDGILFISGEANHAYDPEMKLSSVYRSLILLQDDLLVVIDHIQRDRASSITHTSAFFHNLDFKFLPRKFNNLQGVQLDIPDKLYQMLWLTSDGTSPAGNISWESHAAEAGSRKSFFVNVTTALTTQASRIAYVFLGPDVNFKNIQFENQTSEGCVVTLETLSKKYNILLATDHQNLTSRQIFLNFSGYAIVETGDKKITFGDSLLRLSGTSNHVVQAQCGCDNSRFFSSALGWTLFFCLVIFITLTKHRVRLSTKLKIFVVFVTGAILLPTFFYIIKCGNSKCSSCYELVSQDSLASVFKEVKNRSFFLAVTSLPASGAEILGWIFLNNPDFSVLPISSDLIPFPQSLDKNAQKENLTSFCSPNLYQVKSSKRLTETLKWFSDLKTNLTKSHLFQNLKKEDEKNDIFFGTHSTSLPVHFTGPNVSPGSQIMMKNYTWKQLKIHQSNHASSTPVFFFHSGSWSLKMQALSFLQESHLHQIHLLRDPRSWVANILRDNGRLLKEYRVADMVKNFHPLCPQDEHLVPELRSFHMGLFGKTSEGNHHKTLAWIWRIHISAVLNLRRSLSYSLHILKVEDFLLFADMETRNLYEILGFPVRLRNIQQALQVTRGNIYMLPYEGVMGKWSIDSWKSVLTQQQASDVVEICAPLMQHFGYS